MTMLGSVAAIGIFNLKSRSRKAISFVNSIPILNGDIITGISFPQSLHGSRSQVKSGLINIRIHLLQTRQNAQNNEIRPGMISGFMLALTLSIDDFAVTVFTIGNQGLVNNFTMYKYTNTENVPPCNQHISVLAY